MNSLVSQKALLMALILCSMSVGQVAAADLCFQPVLNYAAGYRPYHACAADFDKDGSPDLVVTNNYNSGSSNTFSLLWNDGTGAFALRTELTAGAQPYGITLADFDKDGDPDLAVTNVYGADVSILMSNGNGTFAAPVNYAVGQHPHDIAAGDLNGDGNVDLAVCDGLDDGISVLLNNGNGTFAGHVFYPAGDGPHDICIADFNGDSRADLVVANYNTDFVSVFMNNGDGTFVPAVNYSVGPAPYSVAAVDLDNDGHVDLAVAVAIDGANGYVAVCKNIGDGTFAAPANYPVLGEPISLVAADLDEDGNVDLAVASWGGFAPVLRNNGDGTFAAAIHYPVGSNSTDILAADLDRDGDDDLVVTNAQNDNVSILLNCSSVRSDSGKIQITVTTGGVLPAIGVAVDVLDTAGNVAAELATAADGKCQTQHLMMGKYQVVILPPLGYMADSEVKTVNLDDDSVVVAFDLSVAPPSRCPRSSEYWSHQVRIALDGKGKAQETVNQLSSYMNTLRIHFNDNRLNSVDVFDVPQPATRTDSLRVLYGVLGGSGKCHDHHSDERTTRARSKALREFTALLLNVASGKLSQSVVISDDGITVSQAITFCYDLIENDEPCLGDDDNWDIDQDLVGDSPQELRSCFKLARHVARRINAGRSVKSGVIPPDVADILYRNQDAPALPSHFASGQNYPNPFNAGTVINYTLGRHGQASVAVFDILGRHVATVVDEFQSAGPHEVAWNGTDAHGQAVASGIYFYRLTAGGFSQSKKMVLLK